MVTKASEQQAKSIETASKAELRELATHLLDDIHNLALIVDALVDNAIGQMVNSHDPEIRESNTVRVYRTYRDWLGRRMSPKVMKDMGYAPLPTFSDSRVRQCRDKAQQLGALLGAPAKSEG